MHKIIVVAGPTASGKTSFAIELAKRFAGEIVSADSMQIYKELNIASAKPTKEEQEGIPHHMMDFLSPFASYSVADYVKQAKECMFDILSRKKTPILAGGTGLYISSLVDNITFTEEPQNPEVRARLYKEVEKEGIEALYNRLLQIDEAAAKNMHPNNIKRVVRALEIYETTGLTLTEQNARSKETPSPFTPYMILLNPPREILYERINQRVDDMVERGLFSETEHLKALGLTKEMQSMQGIGYKEAFDYLEGLSAREECLEEIKQASRRYAKRQLTWFRRDCRYHEVNSVDQTAVECAMEDVRAWINS